MAPSAAAHPTPARRAQTPLSIGGATAAAVVHLVMGQSARIAGYGAVIGLTVAFAAYHPARRATRADPAETLRADA